MEALCLLIGIALPVAAFFLIARRGWRQLAVAAAYQEVARQLGLWADTRGISVHGFHDDRRLWVGEVLESYGTDRRMVPWGVVGLRRPLGLGLSVTPRGRWSRTPLVQPADPELAKRLLLHADDPEAARRLLTPEVETALRRLTDGWPAIEVGDESVRVRLAAPEASPDRLRMLLDTMIGVAAAVERARATLPPPAALAPTVAAWSDAAPALGLTFDPAWCLLHGSLAGRACRIGALRRPDGFVAEIVLRLAVHEPTGLRVLTQSLPGAPPVGQDIQVGDAAFDHAFVLKCWDPLWLTDQLQPHVRAAIHTLGEGVALSIDDRSITLRGVPLDIAHIRARLHDATRVADLFGW